MATVLSGLGEAIPPGSSYFAEPGRYLRKNYRIGIRREIVAEMLGSITGASILDLGCGDGMVTAHLAAANRLTMLDQSRPMLDEARANAPAAHIVQHDVMSYRSGEPADLIVCLGVLAHVRDPIAVLDTIAANLKSGGRCLLQLSPAERPANRLANALFDLRFALGGGYPVTRTNLRDVLTEAGSRGLRLIDQRDHLLLLPGIPRLLRDKLANYDRWVRARPRLAHHGLDTVLLLEKA